MRNRKVTFMAAGFTMFAIITAIMTFIAIFIGYWLVLISACVGTYVGGTIFVEQEKKHEIPTDWYNDVGTVEKDFGKTTKH